LIVVHDVLDAAPELLGGKGYGKEVDWWSFGTLLYEMLTGQPPFVNDDREVMYSKIMNEKLQLPTKIGEVQLHQIVHPPPFSQQLIRSTVGECCTQGGCGSADAAAGARSGKETVRARPDQGPSLLQGH